MYEWLRWFPNRHDEFTAAFKNERRSSAFYPFYDSYRDLFATILQIPICPTLQEEERLKKAARSLENYVFSNFGRSYLKVRKEVTKTRKDTDRIEDYLEWNPAKFPSPPTMDVFNATATIDLEALKNKFEDAVAAAKQGKTRDWLDIKKHLQTDVQTALVHSFYPENAVRESPIQFMQKRVNSDPLNVAPMSGPVQPLGYSYPQQGLPHPGLVQNYTPSRAQVLQVFASAYASPYGQPPSNTPGQPSLSYEHSLPQQQFYLNQGPGAAEYPPSAPTYSFPPGQGQFTGYDTQFYGAQQTYATGAPLNTTYEDQPLDTQGGIQQDAPLLEFITDNVPGPIPDDAWSPPPGPVPVLQTPSSKKRGGSPLPNSFKLLLTEVDHMIQSEREGSPLSWDHPQAQAQAQDLPSTHPPKISSPLRQPPDSPGLPMGQRHDSTPPRTFTPAPSSPKPASAHGLPTGQRQATPPPRTSSPKLDSAPPFHLFSQDQYDNLFRDTNDQLDLFSDWLAKNQN